MELEYEPVVSEIRLESPGWRLNWFLKFGRLKNKQLKQAIEIMVVDLADKGKGIQNHFMDKNSQNKKLDLFGEHKDDIE